MKSNRLINNILCPLLAGILFLMAGHFLYSYYFNSITFIYKDEYKIFLGNFYIFFLFSLPIVFISINIIEGISKEQYLIKKKYQNISKDLTQALKISIFIIPITTIYLFLCHITTDLDEIKNMHIIIASILTGTSVYYVLYTVHIICLFKMKIINNKNKLNLFR